ncbi:MAG: GNAT family N-acetyltransferase [Nocardioides sp.]
MTRSNEHGQPVGEPVEWSGAPAPARVRLTGRYVVVEPVGPVHAADLFDSLCGPDDASLWTYRAEEPPADVAAMGAWVDEWSARSDSLTYALVPTDTGRAAGVASFCRIDPEQGSIEVAAILYARSLQRTRAATEAIRLLAGYVFDDLGYRRFEWKLDSCNAPSAAAARRLGFRYEGRFRQHLVYKGRNRDTDWFAMTDDDWRSLRPAYDAWLAPKNFDEDGRQRRRLSDLTRVAG